MADAIEALDLDDVTLVGNDTGGAICQMLVTTRPERIGRLVLTSCDYRDQFPPAMFAYFGPAARIPGAFKVLFAPMRLRFPRYLPFAFGWLVKRKIDRDAEDSYVLPAGVIRGRRGRRQAGDRRHRQGGPQPGGRPSRRIRQAGADRLVARGQAVQARARRAARARICRTPALEWIDDARTFSMEDNPGRSWPS